MGGERGARRIAPVRGQDGGDEDPALPGPRAPGPTPHRHPLRMLRSIAGPGVAGSPAVRCGGAGKGQGRGVLPARRETGGRCRAWRDRDAGARVCTRVRSEHLPHWDRARCNVCAHAGGSEKPAGTSHGGMRAGVHVCASERLPAPCSRGRVPAATLLAAGAWEGLTRPAWGRGGSGGGSWWGSPRKGERVERGVGGPCFSPNASDTNHFRVFPRDAQTSQKFTDPNPTCKQKRAGAGPPAAPVPSRRPGRGPLAPGPPHMAAG